MKLYRVPIRVIGVLVMYTYTNDMRYIKYIMMKIKKQMSGYFVWVLLNRVQIEQKRYNNTVINRVGVDFSFFFLKHNVCAINNKSLRCY